MEVNIVPDISDKHVQFAESENTGSGLYGFYSKNKFTILILIVIIILLIVLIVYYVYFSGRDKDKDKDKDSFSNNSNNSNNSDSRKEHDFDDRNYIDNAPLPNRYKVNKSDIKRINEKLKATKTDMTNTNNTAGTKHVTIIDQIESEPAKDSTKPDNVNNTKTEDIDDETYEDVSPNLKDIATNESLTEGL